MHSDEPGTDTLQPYRIKRGSASIGALPFPISASVVFSGNISYKFIIFNSTAVTCSNSSISPN